MLLYIILFLLNLVIVLSAFKLPNVMDKAVSGVELKTPLSSPAIFRSVMRELNHSADQMEDAVLDVPDLIKKHGYPVEVHKVITEDGYKLELHRIPHGIHEVPHRRLPKQPILLQHGLLASSADYIVSGPGKALAYILAEEGYDVWLGNARGNYYSRSHLTRDPNIIFSFFWDFSWHEIGVYDLAAMVDHILEVSDQHYLHFVGHSQGSTSFFVLNSVRPEYNGMFLSAHLMAPVANMQHIPVKALEEMAGYTNLLYGLGNMMGMQELFPRSSLSWYDDGQYRCNENEMYTFFCENLIPAYNQIKNPVVHGHFPSGSALKQLAHFGQNIDAQKFQHWSYGPLRNIVVYGNSTPPIYDLSKVTIDTVLIYSDGDVMVAEEDLRETLNTLPRAISIKVKVPDFNHYDFCWSEDAKELVYDYIVQSLKNKKNIRK